MSTVYKQVVVSADLQIPEDLFSNALAKELQGRLVAQGCEEALELKLCWRPRGGFFVKAAGFKPIETPLPDASPGQAEEESEHGTSTQDDRDGQSAPAGSAAQRPGGEAAQGGGQEPA